MHHPSDPEFVNYLPGRWLPEDEIHPVRPDLPWLRHLTFAEGHAMEMGIGASVFLYLSAMVGELSVGFFILVALVRVMIGDKRKDEGGTKCDHTLGIHDLRSDPWYFVIAAIVTAGILMTVFGTPGG